MALAVDADGVHLGQSDMPAEFARQLLGPDKIVGLTVESMAQLQQAQSLPVDYLGISSVFATTTKTDICHQWGLKGLLSAMAESQLPLVAIGGIDLSNTKQVMATGIAGIAVVSAICQQEDVVLATRAFCQLLKL